MDQTRLVRAAPARSGQWVDRVALVLAILLAGVAAFVLGLPWWGASLIGLALWSVLVGSLAAQTHVTHDAGPV